jgi:hypothetical protein
MPIIERDDGVVFAVYTYRELLTVKSSSMLKQEVRLLQEEHGQYARFFQLPSGDFEAVFSSELGYLLGEIVWDYFDQPDDLIFCEALDDGEHALLVVVRESSVYLDAQVSLDTLYDEFASLVTGSHSYDIRIYGDLPLSKTPTEDKFTFEEASVRSFERLKKPVFPQLSADPAFELLPIAHAMDELPLGKAKQIMVVGVVIALALGLGWYFFKPVPPPPPVAPTVVKTAPMIQKAVYAEYQKELQTPAPDEILNQLALTIRKVFTLPGWVPTNIVYDGSTLTIEVGSSGGTLDILLAWVRNNAVDFSNNNEIGTLVFPVTAPNRPLPNEIYNLDDVSAAVYDRLQASIVMGAVSYKEADLKSNYSSTEISVTFQQLSPDVLTLLGVELRGLPVVLEKCTFQVQNGLLSGTINLKILGAD